MCTVCSVVSCNANAEIHKSSVLGTHVTMFVSYTPCGALQVSMSVVLAFVGKADVNGMLNS